MMPADKSMWRYSGSLTTPPMHRGRTVDGAGHPGRGFAGAAAGVHVDLSRRLPARAAARRSHHHARPRVRLNASLARAGRGPRAPRGAGAVRRRPARATEDRAPRAPPATAGRRLRCRRPRPSPRRCTPGRKYLPPAAPDRRSLAPRRSRGCAQLEFVTLDGFAGAASQPRLVGGCRGSSQPAAAGVSKEVLAGVDRTVERGRVEPDLVERNGFLGGAERRGASARDKRPRAARPLAD